MKTLKKRKRIIEIIWLVVLLLALIIFFRSHFGMSGFFDTTISVNFKSTPLLIPKYFVFFFISTLSFFVVYSLKVFTGRFKSAISNTVFLVSIVCLIVVLTYVIAFNMALTLDVSEVVSARSDQPIQEKFYLIDNGYLVLLQVFLVGLFGYIIKKKTLLKRKRF